jgi:hypothetical protein
MKGTISKLLKREHHVFKVIINLFEREPSRSKIFICENSSIIALFAYHQNFFDVALTPRDEFRDAGPILFYKKSCSNNFLDKVFPTFLRRRAKSQKMVSTLYGQIPVFGEKG